MEGKVSSEAIFYGPPVALKMLIIVNSTIHSLIGVVTFKHFIRRHPAINA